MRWTVLIAVAVAFLAAGCAARAPCPPGDDCRWVIDARGLGLWLALDPEAAAVVRLEPPNRPALYGYAVWERCGAEACAWTPPPRQGRLERQENGTWVVSLRRASFARDPASELGAPLADGSRVRLGIYRVNDERDAAAQTDLGSCVADLEATLEAAALGDDGAADPLEVELACRIWLHPEQRRNEMSWHPTLHDVARAHACDMAARDYFAHVDPDGVGPNRRLEAAGYALPDWYDAHDGGNNVESLALRAPTSAPATTLQQWLDSPLHRRHVLGETAFKAEQDDTATGYCRATRDGMEMHYWVFVSARAAP